jgi:hypothetical protein
MRRYGKQDTALLAAYERLKSWAPNHPDMNLYKAYQDRVGCPTCGSENTQRDSDVCGQADFEFHHLRLWPTRLTTPGHVVGITLHECLHVIFENAGLIQLKRGKDDREEQIIVGFETGLVSLLRDNPKLLTWMKKWLK